MVIVSPLFELHQPRRLKRQFGKIWGQKINLVSAYFDDDLNREVFGRVVINSYLPSLKILIEGARAGGMKMALGVSGVFLEQCRVWSPEILRLIVDLLQTGNCELVCQTYYHSLSCLISPEEFRGQIEMHRNAIRRIFNYEPVTIKNTGFIHNNDIASIYGEIGLRTALIDGVERLLEWRSPNYLYRSVGNSVKLLPRNYRLSDSVNFRFIGSSGEPFSTSDYVEGIVSSKGDVILLSFNLETFGEYFPAGVGVHDFLRELPQELAAQGIKTATPNEVASSLNAVGEIDAQETVSGADSEKDLSAWISNDMQKYCLDNLRYLEPIVKHLDDDFHKAWRGFGQSDHFIYMSAKGGETGGIHSYFSHFNSPLEAFLSYMWALTDYRYRLYSNRSEVFRYYRMLYGMLPESHSFQFYAGFAKPTGLRVSNLIELRNAVKTLDEKILSFHLSRGDLSRWSEEVLGNSALAISLRRAEASKTMEGVKDEVIAELEKTISEAQRALKSEGQGRFEAGQIHREG